MYECANAFLQAKLQKMERSLFIKSVHLAEKQMLSFHALYMKIIRIASLSPKPVILYYLLQEQ